MKNIYKTSLYVWILAFMIIFTKQKQDTAAAVLKDEIKLTAFAHCQTTILAESPVKVVVEISPELEQGKPKISANYSWQLSENDDEKAQQTDKIYEFTSKGDQTITLHGPPIKFKRYCRSSEKNEADIGMQILSEKERFIYLKTINRKLVEKIKDRYNMKTSWEGEKIKLGYGSKSPYELELTVNIFTPSESSGVLRYSLESEFSH